MRSLGIGGRGPVGPALVRRIETALADLDTARAELAATTTMPSTVAERRAAHLRVRRAFDLADSLLRQASEQAACAGSYRAGAYMEWSRWRHRLSQLDVARQAHLFAELDDPCVAELGWVRAVDTGMGGPAIGEMQHGDSKPPGTPARYGLDMDEVHAAMDTWLLPEPASGPEVVGDRREPVVEEPTASATPELSLAS
ncbi:MAG: hypothetical protein ACRDPH_16165 [Marmoricola sp.]